VCKLLARAAILTHDYCSEVDTVSVFPRDYFIFSLQVNKNNCFLNNISHLKHFTRLMWEILLSRQYQAMSIDLMFSAQGKHICVRVPFFKTMCIIRS
jgi:hypothetical protein